MGIAVVAQLVTAGVGSVFGAIKAIMAIVAYFRSPKVK